MAAIAVDQVTKQYGALTALDRVDLRVEEGEIFGFLGPNGAGKSTLINMLLDFARPTDGTLELFGHDCQEDGVAARKRVGVLPEGYSVFEKLTAREHVEYAVRAKDADDDPLQPLERVRLRGVAERKAGGFSKGMKQRLVLAMALVGSPDLLLLDEPTTGLDPNGAQEVRAIIREERDRGTAVFFSSHILEQVEAVCDRVAILKGGSLVAVDTIEGLRDSLGGSTNLVITPDGLQNGTIDRVREIAGVESAAVRPDSTIEVTCANSAKMDIIVELHEAGVDVLNFQTEEASLEEMFVEYTSGA